MKQPRRGDTSPRGYGSQRGFTHAPQPAGQVSIGSTSGSVDGRAMPQNSWSAPGFGHSVIPGLGLGVPSTGAAPVEQTSALSVQAADCQEVRPFTAFPDENTAAPPAQGIRGPSSIPGLGQARDDTMEDGEVSEDGEVDDAYDPSKPLRELSTPEQRQVFGPLELMRQPKDASERSGSYSPYLSPHEISRPENQFDSTRNDIPLAPLSLQGTASDQMPVSMDKSSEPTAVTPRHPADNLATNPSTGSALLPSTKDHQRQQLLKESREQAKEVILRLWPLNIRFSHYVAEGVDEALLRSLFQDLGLSTGERNPKSEAETITTPKSNSKPQPKPKPPPMEHIVPSQDSVPQQPQTAPIKVLATTVITAPTTDKSEERKDRIARLLAAKGSKPSPIPPIASTTAEIPGDASAGKAEAKSSRPAMTQSEKSKLLQQKMAALKQARALLQQKSTRSPGVDADRKTPSPAIAAPMTGIVASPQEEKASRPASETRLSPNRQTVPLSGAPDLPLAAQIKSQSGVVVPFHQNKTSRPFLINVSDDEDEEMDIDSPGRPDTPHEPLVAVVQPDASLNDMTALSDPVIIPRLKSAELASMPTHRSAGRANGVDLESMNKEIEEMKRKIAQAEARKMAKISQQASPASSIHDEKPQDGDRDEATCPAPTTKPSYGELNAGAQMALSSPLDRQSQSRAASERLPILEARRKGQQERLRSLQSEVARIERELEEDLLEEERLKGDILDSDFDSSGQPSLALANANSHPDACTLEEKPQSEVVASEDPDPSAAFLGDGPSRNRASSLKETGLANRSVNAGDDRPDNASSRETRALTATEQSALVDPKPLDHDESTPNKETDVLSASPASLEDVEMEDAEDSNATDGLGDDDELIQEILSMAKDSTSDLQSDLQDAQKDLLPQGQVAADVTSMSPGNLKRPMPTETSGPTAKRQATSFVPYETPLRQFRAFRFHPQFQESIAGGLRSLTYSNKIDVKRELCPDELAGHQCPRGSQCIFQHFGTMQAPDDQILLQLGAADHYDEQRKQAYISGLRELLTDFHNRKVRDFGTISQGIIDYRARFLGDKTKILPLGHVAL
ncbi:Zinc finger, CCCH-type [Moelleriella libera RCEF 2490]|uniref:Zinc finger, CCCH-type n=1 Tax=Moelleriella libera RCEF 2490 TaxID=1081109 RepID=A0A162INQ7_9HYPO|nr:Zinc finger, CCCH-type [Moelleriella libera RCEF 2490]